MARPSGHHGPPTATKSTDVDGIGQIVDVNDFDGPGVHSWVTAQLNRREKYLDLIRAKVRAGAFRLTAELAKMLGMAFDGDAAELVPRTGTGTVAYRAATAKSLVEEGGRLAGLPVDRDTGLPIVRGRSTDEARVKSVAAAAAKRYAETGDYSAAVAEVMAGLERTRKTTM